MLTSSKMPAQIWIETPRKRIEVEIEFQPGFFPGLIIAEEMADLKEAARITPGAIYTTFVQLPSKLNAPDFKDDHSAGPY